MLLMDENQEQRKHLKCRNYDDRSLHRRRCKFTGDDAGTLLGICVGLFIVLASALVYVMTIDLAVLLGRSLVFLWLYLHTW